MASKLQTIFTCSNCDSQFPKWVGRCPSCGAWNTLAEGQVSAVAQKINAKAGSPVSLARVDSLHMRRLSTGDTEVDQILGTSDGSSGLVPGSLVLLGGDPGIGKSTLSLQLALKLSQNSKVLYVSGEESLPQIKLRAQRISRDLDTLQVLSENNLDVVLATVDRVNPDFLVVDSIQTMYSEGASGVAGGVAQVSYATGRIMEMAKSKTIATLIIGHVTKEGNLAGPKMLEHMVDVVLYLEGDRFLSFRVLRCIKNRFGTTNEVGVFEMKEEGLAAVANPSGLFLAQRVMTRPGNAVTCTIEGTRALMLEIQALTARMQFSYPKRTATGYDANRLQLLAAVLQQRLHLNVSEQDIFLSVAGGFKINEAACDLAAALAIVSSLKDFVIGDDVVAIGEVGLSGEVRGVGQTEKRIAEAAKLGFKKMIVPAASKVTSSKIQLFPVTDIADAIRLVSKK